MTRRQAVAALAAAGRLHAAAVPLVETHVHLFDPERVPYAPAAPYKPPAYSLESHLRLAAAVPLTHAIVVHPGFISGRLRHLEYAAHEPRPGYSKGLASSICFAKTLPNVSASGGPPAQTHCRHAHPRRQPHGANSPAPSATATWIPACSPAGSRSPPWELNPDALRIPAQAEHLPSLPKSPRPPSSSTTWGFGDGTPEEYRAVLKLAEPCG